MKSEKPKIACLPNGPYYLLNDMTPRDVPNLVDAKGKPCATVTGVPCADAVPPGTNPSVVDRIGTSDSRTEQ